MEHLKIARFARDLTRNEDTPWDAKNGRKLGSTISADESKIAKRLSEWLEQHPKANKSEAALALNLSRPTVAKWWPEEQSLKEKIADWRALNPECSKAQCAREIGTSRNTVAKYWE